VGVPVNGDSGDDDRVRLDPSALREVSWKELLLRFAFGAGVSALAGGVSHWAGAWTGGIFLAFPAIALASFTMVADNEGLRRARDDARGATLGTLGLLAFAVVGGFLLPRTSAWAALPAAALAWAVVSSLGYLVLRLSGHGGDEPQPRRDSSRE
jgi:uncharacterized membrane protein (GlpM family)